MNNKAVSSVDYSFDARNDGKHIYCFSNEAWSASTKEVSFNVHGIVYVPESEAPNDPLEMEGAYLYSIHERVWRRVETLGDQRPRGCDESTEQHWKKWLKGSWDSEGLSC